MSSLTRFFESHIEILRIIAIWVLILIGAIALTIYLFYREYEPRPRKRD
jgi:hypothetical protein